MQALLQLQELFPHLSGQALETALQHASQDVQQAVELLLSTQTQEASISDNDNLNHVSVDVHRGGNVLEVASNGPELSNFVQGRHTPVCKCMPP